MTFSIQDHNHIEMPIVLSTTNQRWWYSLHYFGPAVRTQFRSCLSYRAVRQAGMQAEGAVQETDGSYRHAIYTVTASWAWVTRDSPPPAAAQFEANRQTLEPNYLQRQVAAVNYGNTMHATLIM